MRFPTPWEVVAWVKFAARGRRTHFHRSSFNAFSFSGRCISTTATPSAGRSIFTAVSLGAGWDPSDAAMVTIAAVRCGESGSSAEDRASW